VPEELSKNNAFQAAQNDPCPQSFREAGQLYIRGTTTKTGLTVTAELDEDTYRKGQTVSKEDVERWRLTAHSVCPEWKFPVVRPDSGASATSVLRPEAAVPFLVPSLSENPARCRILRLCFLCISENLLTGVTLQIL
jgi:hypothetical protein